MLKSAVKHAYIRWLLRQEAKGGAVDYPEQGFLPPGLWGYDISADGELLVQGVSIPKLVQEYGTPLHVINEGELLKSYQEFLGCFESGYPRVALATSYKTNPVPYVLKFLHKAGSWAEVISHFELWLALELGVSPDRLILNGPGKGTDALRLAVDRGVRLINIDAPGEIDVIAQLARSIGAQQKVGLRVTTSVGWSSQFGVSLSSGAALACFERMQAFPELLPVGLHLHLGTGIQSVQTYVQAVSEVVEFSEQLKSLRGVEISHFDLGGGFGVPTVRGMTEWDLRMLSLGYPARSPRPEHAPKPADYVRALRPLLRRIEEQSAGEALPPQVILEPGRAITSSSQSLSLSVIGKKAGLAPKEHVILDGGKNISMPLGWETHQIFAATRMGSEATHGYDMFGPLCHPGDVVVKNAKFPSLDIGDVVTIMDAGAYFIPNQMNFSNPRPAIVSVANGEVKLVRRRERFEDIIRLDETG